MCVLGGDGENYYSTNRLRFMLDYTISTLVSNGETSCTNSILYFEIRGLQVFFRRQGRGTQEISGRVVLKFKIPPHNKNDTNVRFSLTGARKPTGEAGRCLAKDLFSHSHFGNL